jgi:hypothetical protein
MIQSYKINQNTQKKGKTMNKMEGPKSKRTNEPPKKANHKGNIKFPNPFQSLETHQIRKGKDFLKKHLA